MGVTQISPDRFRARYTEKGVRHNVGTFASRKEAEDEIARHKFRSGMDYEETPIKERGVALKPGTLRVAKPTLTERLKAWLSNLKKSLERKNLI